MYKHPFPLSEVAQRRNCSIKTFGTFHNFCFIRTSRLSRLCQMLFTKSKHLKGHSVPRMCQVFSSFPYSVTLTLRPRVNHFSKVPINRRNCVSPISRHFSKVCINRRNYVSPISRHFSAEPSAAGARRGVRKCTCDKCTLPTIPLDTFQNCL